MKRRVLVIFVTIVAVFAGGGNFVKLFSGPAFAAADKSDPVAGKVLYTQNCATCHGDQLQGQPNWRSQGEDGLLPAPPHDETGHTWHHPDGLLFSYTKLGGKQVMAQNGVAFKSGMPGFGDQLSDRQIWDILAYIKSTWPDRQREVQASRSEAEQLQKEANQ